MRRRRLAAMPALGRPHLRLLVALLAVGGILSAGWLALRDSGLVAVERVEVRGASGPQAEAVRAALTDAARDLTTLHVRPAVLRTAVADYPQVKAVRADADFPNGLRVDVVEHVPVATVTGVQGPVPVAADGTILEGTAAEGVPAIVHAAGTGARVSEGRTLRTLSVLGRAPAPLRRRISEAFSGPRGLTLRLREGPSVHFGTTQRAKAKWLSLASVLAAPGARGASSIDVRVPEHPAASGLEQKSIQRGESLR